MRTFEAFAKILIQAESASCDDFYFFLRFIVEFVSLGLASEPVDTSQQNNAVLWSKKTLSLKGRFGHVTVGYHLATTS